MITSRLSSRSKFRVQGSKVQGTRKKTENRIQKIGVRIQEGLKDPKTLRPHDSMTQGLIDAKTL
jgi:hypothetical protein